MGLNTREMHYGEKAAPYIAEAGGKIGGLNFLKATVPALKDAILPLQVVQPGERLGEIKVPEGTYGQYIVRGSHPMDFQGLVDVLATKVDDQNIDKWVEHVQYQALRPAVMAYGKYENPDFDGRVWVGVQPYLSGQRGSVVEHPNLPGSYVMSFVPTDYQTGTDSANTGIYEEKEESLKHVSGHFEEIVGGAEDRAKQIVDLYKKVDESGLVKPGFSFQTEFLNAEDQVYIAQVRAFKKKEQATFQLSERDRLVFGVTSPEGIVLPVYLSPDGFTYGDQPDGKEPWAYLKPVEPGQTSMRDIFRPRSETQIEADALKFKPTNMAAYLIGQSFGSQLNAGLEHNHFRVAQKAGITVFEIGSNYQGERRGEFTNLFFGDPGDKGAHEQAYANILSMASIGAGTTHELMRSMFEGRLMHKVKIVSDGKTATVEPVASRKRRR